MFKTFKFTSLTEECIIYKNEKSKKKIGKENHIINHILVKLHDLKFII